MGERDILVMPSKMVILLFFFLTPIISFGQSEKESHLKEFIQQYFMIDLENHSPDQIIQSLRDSMRLKIDIVRPRTDTSLMYIKAYSIIYNPFNISIRKMELQFLEQVIRSSRKKGP